MHRGKADNPGNLILMESSINDDSDLMTVRGIVGLFDPMGAMLYHHAKTRLGKIANVHLVIQSAYFLPRVNQFFVSYTGRYACIA